MPFFLFIMGISMPLSFNSFLAKSPREGLVIKVLKRTCKLFILGLLLQGGPLLRYDLSKLRIMGILQRIAIAYGLISSIVIFLPSMSYNQSDKLGIYKKHILQWCGAGIVVLVYVLLTFVPNVPGCGMAKLDPQCNALAYLDRKILGESHLYSVPTFQRLPECSSCSPGLCPLPDMPEWCSVSFDPEGLTASIGASLSTYIGVHFGQVMVMYKQDEQRIVHWFLFSLVSVIAGLIIHFTFMPLNKNLYSLSYMLVTTGCGGFFLCLFYVIIDMYGKQAPFRPFISVGKNALVIFIGAACSLLRAALSIFYWQSHDNNIVSFLYRQLFRSWLQPSPAILIFTFFKLAFWIIVAEVMNQKGVYVII